MNTPVEAVPVEEVLADIQAELEFARQKWPPFHSAHEGYSVILEELGKLWDHIQLKQKHRNIGTMYLEAILVAAMAARFALEVCNEKHRK